MICFGLFGVFATYPLLSAIGGTRSVAGALSLVVVGLAGVSFYSSVSGLVKAEMFPAEIRGMGVGLPYAIANALFGGTAEYVALWFKSRGVEAAFFWYTTAVAAIGLLAALAMPDSRVRGYLRD